MADTKIKANLRSKIRWGVFGIFVLLLGAGIFVAPQGYNKLADKINDTVHIGIPKVPEKNFRLGLDLQGGVHLVYEADTVNIEADERAVSIEGVRDVIERRVNGMGVGEPVVQTTKVGESYRLVVELPGVTDVHEAISMIGGTPILEFKEQSNEPPRELTAEEQAGLDEFNSDAKKRAEEILNRIKNNENFEEVAKQTSEDIVSKNNGGYLGFVAKDSPYVELYNWAEKVSEGTVSQELVETYEGYNIVKRGAEQEGTKEVKASHILICYQGAPNCTSEFSKEDALQKANEIYDQANASNFAQLAKEFSTDLGSAEMGGDLGWFTKERMVAPFAEASFGAEKGQIIGPVETEFGYHIIYKEDERALTEYEISRILVKTQNAIDILGPQDPWKVTGLSGKQLERSEVVTDQQTGQIQVALNFDSEGKELFKDITSRNVGQPVAIYLDGQPISVPTVNQVIGDGRAVISGSFNLQEAKLLSQRLNAGALPVPVNLVSQEAIGASLGAESLAKSLTAGIVGVLLVMLFMFLYYRLPGLLSVISLTIYILFTLAIFKLIGVTLTLAGIAGFILSIGMAVDANVLIFERLKEELKAGKSLKTAIEEGFVRAWSSIRDGNISTLITCVLLIWFGSSFVQGFAVTLAIGILISMFTAITITRTFLRFVAPWFKKEDGGWVFLGRKTE